MKSKPTNNKMIILIVATVLVLVILGLILNYYFGEPAQLRAMTPEQKEAYLQEKAFETEIYMLKSNINTMLPMVLTGDEPKADIKFTQSSCEGNNKFDVTLHVDMTGKSKGLIDTLISDLKGWSVTESRDIMKKMYTDIYNENYRTNVQHTTVIPYYYDDSQSDEYGNPLPKEKIYIGEISMCNNEAEKVNWKNIELDKFENLADLNWEESEVNAVGTEV